jgi:hypothetical protein
MDKGNSDKGEGDMRAGRNSERDERNKRKRVSGRERGRREREGGRSNCNILGC